MDGVAPAVSTIRADKLSREGPVERFNSHTLARSTACLIFENCRASKKKVFLPPTSDLRCIQVNRAIAASRVYDSISVRNLAM